MVRHSPHNHEMEAITMNEDKKELLENELEKVAGGKTRRASLEKDLSDEDREKLKELEKQIADRM